MTDRQIVLADAYRRAVRAIDAKDLSALTALYQTDGAVHLCQDLPNPGPAGIADFYRPLFEAFPDLRIQPQVILVNGDNIATIELLTGTHQGTFLGHPPTGKPIGLLGARYIHAPDGGPFLKDTFFLDPRTILGQIGASQRKHRHARSSGLSVKEGGLPSGEKEVVLASGSTHERALAHLANRQVAIFTTHDRDAFVPTLEPDGIVANCTQDHDAEGSNAIGDHIAAFHVAFPKSLAVPTEFWGAGDWAVSIVEFSGHNSGRLMSGLPATLQSVSLDLLEIRKFKNNRVWREWIFMNGLAMAKQLKLA